MLLTTAGVLGMLGLANLAHGAVNRGGAFTHNWLMIFFQLVMTFMPVLSPRGVAQPGSRYVRAVR